ncbi:MAG: serine protease [Gammaproteobacteria bacterium]
MDILSASNGYRASRRGLVVGLALAIGLLTTLPALAVPPTAIALPNTITRIKPSIVGVGTVERTRRPPVELLGTGFAVGDGRHVLTNAHVVPKLLDKGDFEYLAVFSGQGNNAKTHQAEVVATDRSHDLAVLKISGPPLRPMALGDDSTVREGQFYAFTGFPIGMILGLYPVTHRGMISCITPIAVPVNTTRTLSSEVIARLRDPYRVYQLDATAYPGNSGSPLYDMETGRVVAIVNKVLVQGSKENALRHPSGISFAVPIKYAKALLRKAGVGVGR